MSRAGFAALLAVLMIGCTAQRASSAPAAGERAVLPRRNSNSETFFIADFMIRNLACPTPRLAHSLK